MKLVFTKISQILWLNSDWSRSRWRCNKL